MSRFRLELVYISLIDQVYEVNQVNIRSSLTHLHGFQLLVLVLQLIEITFIVCTKMINLLILK